MARTKSKSGRVPAGVRASWRGFVTFGLVSFPVEAINAVNRAGREVDVHQLHAKCHSRIKYKKVCPIHGEVTNNEIISGYEHKKGKYVEIEKGELDELRSDQERALRIDTFVSPDTV